MTAASTVQSDDSHLEVERFLHEEAALLDAWDLDGWYSLFLPDATYEIPTDDAGGESSAVAQYFIADDSELLRVRISRLKSRNAHSENPRSRTHRMISCIRVTDEDPYLRVRASFVVHRIRDGNVDPYIGWYDHLLLPTPQGLRFRRRRSVLATVQLAPGSRLSFIL